MGSLLNKNVTAKINWCLENVMPPFMHEWKGLMYLIIYFAYGKNAKLVMEFRDKYPFMTQDEISHYYKIIVDAPINRKRQVDLTSCGMKYVLKNIKGHSVLDAACGRGFLAKQILSMGKGKIDVAGLDIVIPKEVRKIQNIDFYEGLLQALPFKDDSFDTVVCTHALEHIPEYRQAINELIRVAVKRVIIVIPCQREYRYSADLHVNFVPYLYRFKVFVGIPEAKYEKIGKEFICVVDKNKSDSGI